MDEHIGRTRIAMKRGPTYCVTEDVATVMGDLERGVMIPFTSVTGQAAFPPEKLFVRVDEVASVQEVSPEGWVWMQRAAELHYARQIEEHVAGDRVAAAQERLVEALTGGDDD